METASLTPDNAPRDYQSLLNLQKVSRFRLGNALQPLINFFQNELEESAFMSATAEEQSARLLDGLQRYDAQRAQQGHQPVMHQQDMNYPPQAHAPQHNPHAAPPPPPPGQGYPPPAAPAQGYATPGGYAAPPGFTQPHAPAPAGYGAPPAPGGFAPPGALPHAAPTAPAYTAPATTGFANGYAAPAGGFPPPPGASGSPGAPNGYAAPPPPPGQGYAAPAAPQAPAAPPPPHVPGPALAPHAGVPQAPQAPAAPPPPQHFAAPQAPAAAPAQAQPEVERVIRQQTLLLEFLVTLLITQMASNGGITVEELVGRTIQQVSQGTLKQHLEYLIAQVQQALPPTGKA